MEQSARILLVEDDKYLAELIRDYLQKQGFEVLLEERGDTAPARVLREKPDMLILDLMLPGRDGLSICQAIRADFRGPILILTAREDDMDHVAGLEIGADDFVNKPIEPRVLLARIRALLRRVPRLPELQAAPGKELRFGGLSICPAAHTVSLDGCEVELTTTEFKLLCLLASNAGTIMDRDRLFQELRGIEYDGLDRSIDVNILRLRKKFEVDPAQPKRIKTIWSQGYLFVKEAWQTQS